jgi:hypothetical protein
LPENSIRHLGRFAVKGRRREPCPALRIMAFLIMGTADVTK